MIPAFRQRRAGALLLTMLMLPMTVSAASSTGGRREKSPEQQQALFQAHKSWAKNSYNRRLELLQSSQRCVESAESIKAMKSCRDQKRTAMRAYKTDKRAYLNDVRQQVGLPELKDRKKAGKRRKRQA